MRKTHLPAYPNREGPLLPIAAFDQRQFAGGVGAGTCEELVRVAVVVLVYGGGIVGVGHCGGVWWGAVESVVE